MKYNYFFGLLLAIIFPGLIQYYVKEKQKGSTYIVMYLISFLIIFVFLTLNGHYIDLNDIDSILQNELLLNLSLIINIVFRIISGIDGFIKMIQLNRYYG